VSAYEVGTRDGHVVVILSVRDDDTGAIAAAGVQLVPDDAKALVNDLGAAILNVSRMVRT
jgi:hypothetical protein